MRRHAAASALLLLPVLANCAAPVDANLGRPAVVGYVPEYRFPAADWPGLLRSTTHLVLFSFQPDKNATLLGSPRLSDAFTVGSPLVTALGDVDAADRAKLMVCIGGAGLSEHFPVIMRSKKLRSRLIENMRKLLDARPFIGGFDIDWEVIENKDQLTDLAKFGRDFRAAFSDRSDLLLTTTFHPGSGIVQQIAVTTGKGDGMRMVDLFDMFHAMVYTSMDAQKRHSTEARDEAVVGLWTSARLPASKLTIGVPLFGLTKEGQTKAYADIVAEEPSLAHRVGVDTSRSGTYFVNARSITSKVRSAKKAGIAGVMLWELGADTPLSEPGSLLKHVWRARETDEDLAVGMAERLWSAAGFGQDELMGILAALAGGYLVYQTLTAEMPRDRFRRRPAPGAACCAKKHANGAHEPSGCGPAPAEGGEEDQDAGKKEK